MTAAPERADARANHRRLLAAAAELFAERGVNAEIRDVAERAGLSVGAVYRHFPSKEDLVAAIIDVKLCEVEQVVEAAAAVEDAILAVRTLIRSGVELALRRGELTKALLESGALGTSHARADARRQAIVTTMRDLIARGVTQGTFRPDLDPAIAVAMLECAFLPWSIAALREERSIDELVDRFTELFLGGAANRRLAGSRTHSAGAIAP